MGAKNGLVHRTHVVADDVALVVVVEGARDLADDGGRYIDLRERPVVLDRQVDAEVANGHPGTDANRVTVLAVLAFKRVFVDNFQDSSVVGSQIHRQYELLKVNC